MKKILCGAVIALIGTLDSISCIVIIAINDVCDGAFGKVYKIKRRCENGNKYPEFT